MFNLDPSSSGGSFYGIYLIGIILIIVVGGLVTVFKDNK